MNLDDYNTAAVVADAAAAVAVVAVVVEDDWKIELVEQKIL